MRPPAFNARFNIRPFAIKDLQNAIAVGYWTRFITVKSTSEEVCVRDSFRTRRGNPMCLHRIKNQSSMSRNSDCNVW